MRPPSVGHRYPRFYCCEVVGFLVPILGKVMKDGYKISSSSFDSRGFSISHYLLVYSFGIQTCDENLPNTYLT